MEEVGVLWDEEVTWDGKKPFDGESNQSYGYFSKRAETQDLRLVHAQYNWYDGGVLSKGWIYVDGSWQKVKDVEISSAFDKFHFDANTKGLKQDINQDIGILNHPELEELCKDKLLTYETFRDVMPETRSFSNSNARKMIDKYGKVAVKPRYDFGGTGIQMISHKDDIPDFGQDYVVQRYIDSSRGIEGIVNGTHDLRGIVVNGELKSGYVRYSDGEISNVAQGGSKDPVSPGNFPERALEVIDLVNRDLDYMPCLFSVDLFFDRQRKPWIVELNSKPGIGFYGDDSMKEELNPMIDSLVEALKQI